MAILPNFNKLYIYKFCGPIHLPGEKLSVMYKTFKPNETVKGLSCWRNQAITCLEVKKWACEVVVFVLMKLFLNSAMQCSYPISKAPVQQRPSYYKLCLP